VKILKVRDWLKKAGDRVVKGDLVLLEFYVCIQSHPLKTNELERQFFDRRILDRTVLRLSVPSFSSFLRVSLAYLCAFPLFSPFAQEIN